MKKTQSHHLKDITSIICTGLDDSMPIIIKTPAMGVTMPLSGSIGLSRKMVFSEEEIKFLKDVSESEVEATITETYSNGDVKICKQSESEVFKKMCACSNVPVDVMKHPIDPDYRRFNISKKYPRKLKKKLFSTRSRRRKRYYSSSAMYSKIYDRQLSSVIPHIDPIKEIKSAYILRGEDYDTINELDKIEYKK